MKNGNHSGEFLTLPAIKITKPYILEKIKVEEPITIRFYYKTKIFSSSMESFVMVHS
jgi:hypothetical protein